MTEEEMINARRAGEFLGLSRATILKWGRLGKLPRYKYSPKAVRFSLADLEEFKRRCRR